MSSEDEPGHVHQWKRWPVVDFRFDYQCSECGEPGMLVLGEAHAAMAVDEIDQEFIRVCGGVFAGEMVLPRA